MKYVMFEHDLEGVTQKIPIIFPDRLVHADVAERMRHLLRRVHKIDAKPVSAGFVNLGLISCYGESETLGLSARNEDGAIIETMDYLHGIVG